jgi:hypothetical protein
MAEKEKEKDPKEEKEEKVQVFMDYYAAILIGITTILAALAGFYGALWGGNCMDSYNKAILTISESNTAYLEALHEYSMFANDKLKDDLLYVEWKKHLEAGDPDAEYLFSRLSEGLQADLLKYEKEGATEEEAVTEEETVTEEEGTTEEETVTEEEGTTEEETVTEEEGTTEEETVTEEEGTTEEGATEEGLTEEDKEDEARLQEIDAIFEESDIAYEQVEKMVNDAQKANKDGDEFGFVTVLFTIVLFFGGMSAVSSRLNLKYAYLGAATLMFIYSLIKMFSLPFPQ